MLLFPIFARPRSERRRQTPTQHQRNTNATPTQHQRNTNVTQTQHQRSRILSVSACSCRLFWSPGVATQHPRLAAMATSAAQRERTEMRRMLYTARTRVVDGRGGVEVAENILVQTWPRYCFHRVCLRGPPQSRRCMCNIIDRAGDGASDTGGDCDGDGDNSYLLADKC